MCEKAPVHAHLGSSFAQVLSFFSGERVGLLCNLDLQALLEAVLFEPGSWKGSAALADSLANVQVPMPTAAFGTPTGTLVDELTHSARCILEDANAMLAGMLDLCRNASFQASCVVGIVAVSSMCSRLQASASLALSVAPTRTKGAAAVHVCDVPELVQRLEGLLAECRALLNAWLSDAVMAHDRVRAMQFCSHLVAMSVHSFTEDGSVEDLTSVLRALSYVSMWFSHFVSETVEAADPAERQRPPLGSVKTLQLMQGMSVLSPRCLRVLLELGEEERSRVLSEVVDFITVGGERADLLHWKLASAPAALQDADAAGVFYEASGRMSFNVLDAQLLIQGQVFEPLPTGLSHHPHFVEAFGESTNVACCVVQGNVFSQEEEPLVVECWRDENHYRLVLAKNEADGKAADCPHLHDRKVAEESYATWRGERWNAIVPQQGGTPAFLAMSSCVPQQQRLFSSERSPNSLLALDPPAEPESEPRWLELRYDARRGNVSAFEFVCYGEVWLRVPVMVSDNRVSLSECLAQSADQDAALVSAQLLFASGDVGGGGGSAPSLALRIYRRSVTRNESDGTGWQSYVPRWQLRARVPDALLSAAFWIDCNVRSEAVSMGGYAASSRAASAAAAFRVEEERAGSHAIITDAKGRCLCNPLRHDALVPLVALENASWILPWADEELRLQDVVLPRLKLSLFAGYAVALC